MMLKATVIDDLANNDVALTYRPEPKGPAPSKMAYRPTVTERALGAQP